MATYGIRNIMRPSVRNSMYSPRAMRMKMASDSDVGKQMVQFCNALCTFLVWNGTIMLHHLYFELCILNVNDDDAHERKSCERTFWLIPNIGSIRIQRRCVVGFCRLMSVVQA